MRSKLLNADPPVTYAVMLGTGDEGASELRSFVRQNEVETASVTAIGAFHDALLGYFDWQTKQYKQIAVDEQAEVLSLLGDVAVAEKGQSLHLHVVLGKADGSTVGGHLLEAHGGHPHPAAELSTQTLRPDDRLGAYRAVKAAESSL